MQSDIRIQVTSKGWDNIGEIISSIGVQYEEYKIKNRIDCDILFMNCGSIDMINPEELRNFVHNGGVLYASDLTSFFLDSSFPNIFFFSGSGQPQIIEAEICDNRVIEFLGRHITIKFDIGAWSMLSKVTTGHTIIKRSDNGNPLMVEVPYNEGRIYYTSFHNHAQASEKEIALLKILILTELSFKDKTSILDIADKIKFDLNPYKDRWGEGTLSTTQKPIDSISQKKKKINLEDFDFTNDDSNTKKKNETQKPDLSDLNF